MSDRLHDEVFRLLRQSTGQDFSGYKSSTIERRLRRRMLFSGAPDLEAYVKRLDADVAELLALHRDLLIGVTNFFRDADTFEFLATAVIPELLAAAALRAGGGPFVWAAGCASGREAYSLAILLSEAAGGRPPAEARVFGTDVSQEYVQAAASGVYSGDIAGELGPERLKRFFVEQPDAYSVCPELREVCTFTRHDVTGEPPRTGLDLVSCRNVLIYFEAAQQRRVFEGFHRALRPGGLVLLGRSESALAAGRLFEAVNEAHRLYRKVEA